MRKFLQNKLWRDKLPEAMERAGSKIHCRILNDAEFDEQLKLKFLEEAAEVAAAKNTTELVEELADVLEVMQAMCCLHNVLLEDVQKACEKKHQERGGFDARKFVTFAEHLPNSSGERYCLAQPEKYPEVF